MVMDDFPTARFFKIDAIIRPNRLDKCINDLSDAGIVGVTVSSVVGMGVQGMSKERYKGAEFGLKALVEKSRVEVVCTRDQVDDVVRTIAIAAHCGEIGDGKVFIVPVVDVIRIRTGETGGEAEKMEGGRFDRLQGSQQ